MKNNDFFNIHHLPEVIVRINDEEIPMNNSKIEIFIIIN